MEKIEFYQRSASKIIENILSTFFQILSMNFIKYFDLVVCFEKKNFLIHKKNRILSKVAGSENYRKYFIDIFSNFSVCHKIFDLVVCFEKIINFYFIKKIEFYQRWSLKIIENILSKFFKILAMYVIKYFDLVVCFEKIINF